MERSGGYLSRRRPRVALRGGDRRWKEVAGGSECVWGGGGRRGCFFLLFFFTFFLLFLLSCERKLVDVKLITE